MIVDASESLMVVAGYGKVWWCRDLDMAARDRNSVREENLPGFRQISRRSLDCRKSPPSVSRYR